MWARVSTYDGSPEDIEETTSYAREKILPQVRELAGFRGVFALADPQTGKGMSITLWDSEEAMRASETDADRLRQDSVDHTDGSVVGVERFEVTFHELT